MAAGKNTDGEMRKSTDCRKRRLNYAAEKGNQT
jgi:hypothetical protein